MNQPPATTRDPRQIWRRGLLMLLMALAFQLASTLLGLLAVVQFLLAVFSGAPNERLQVFGLSLGRYLQQIAEFVSFSSEQRPFPFSDWPSERP